MSVGNRTLCKYLKILSTDRNHLALGGHVGGAVAQAQLGLKSVEVGLQFGLLFDARRLVLAPENYNPFYLVLNIE